MGLILQRVAPAVTRRKEKPAPAVTRRKEKSAPAVTRRKEKSASAVTPGKEYDQIIFGHILSCGMQGTNRLLCLYFIIDINL